MARCRRVVFAARSLIAAVLARKDQRREVSHRVWQEFCGVEPFCFWIKRADPAPDCCAAFPFSCW